MGGIRTIAIAMALLWLASCSSYVVLHVQDPEGHAVEAEWLAVGDDLGTLQHVDLEGRSLPLSVTVSSATAGNRVLWVEALSQDGVTLARASITGSLSHRNLPLIVTLGRPCDGSDSPSGDGVIDARCDDGVFCNGPEICLGRVCQSGKLPCPGSPFACVDVACLEDFDKCGVNVHHDVCDGERPICDPGAGCIVGPPCDTDEACQNGLSCDGVEHCDTGRCAPGLAPTGADNQCAASGCTEDEGVLYSAANEGRYCPLPGAPNDAGVCRDGLCGLLDDGSVFCSSDAQCQDGSFCNGAEPCIANRCFAGSEVVIGDGNPCTSDVCGEASGVVHAALADLTSCPLPSAPGGAGLCLRGICTHPGAHSVDAGPDVTLPPAGIVVTGQDGSIEVSWTDEGDDTTVEVRWREEGSQEWTTSEASADDGSLLIGSLDNDVAHEVEVRASRSDGVSDAVTFTVTTRPSPPAVPAGLAATSGQNGEVPVSFDAVANATSYQLRHRQVGAASFTTTTLLAPATLVTGLSNDTTYEFQVRATNTGGSSAFSPSVMATPTPDAPAVPTGLAATSGQSTQVPVSWTAVSGAVSYQVQHRVSGGGAFTLGTPVTGTSTIITGLTNDTTYDFQVRATSTGGSSSFSTSVTATPRPSAPAVPTGLAATSGQSAQVPVSWTAVSGAVSYQVQHRVSGAGAFTLGTAVTGTSTIITGLTNDTTYDFQVRATNTGGSSAFSTSVTATPADAFSTSIASDAFTRTLGSSWGPADLGGTWGLFRGSSSPLVVFSVNGSKGVVTVPANKLGDATLGISQRDARIRARVSVADIATRTGTADVKLIARAGTADAVTGVLELRSSRAELSFFYKDSLIGPTTVSSTTPPTEMFLELEVSGGTSTLMCGRAWAVTDSRPAACNLSATRSSSGTAGPIAVGAGFSTAGVVTFDDIQVFRP